MLLIYKHTHLYINFILITYTQKSEETPLTLPTDFLESETMGKAFLFSIFWDGLCKSPRCAGVCFVQPAGLELTEIHLKLPPECWG